MAYTDVELILDQLEDIKELTASELSLIEQISVKVLPDKVVNQAERLKNAFVNPITSTSGLPKYLAIRFVAINQVITDIKNKWNTIIPTATTDITSLKQRLDTLMQGVSTEYNQLFKIELIVKQEISNRKQAITDLINNASTDYNTLKKLEDKIKQEVTARGQAITDLKGDAGENYNSLGKLEDAIQQEVLDRNTAISNAISALVNGAGDALDTLQELAKALGDDPNFATTVANNIAQTLKDAKSYTDTKVSAEATARDTAISTAKNSVKSELKGDVITYDTLGKLEDAINTEVSAREEAITGLIDGASSKTLKSLEDKIDAIVGTTEEGDVTTIQGAILAAADYTNTKISEEVANRNSAIETAKQEVKNELLDGAGTAFDTLKELADALGNDPNFSTTILNKIAQNLTDSKAYTDEKTVSTLTEAKSYTDAALKNRDTIVQQKITCTHQYEITGNTNDEHGLAVKDQQMVINKISGQTRRYSLNVFNPTGNSFSSGGLTYTIEKNIITVNGTVTNTNSGAVVQTFTAGSLGLISMKICYISGSITNSQGNDVRVILSQNDYSYSMDVGLSSDVNSSFSYNDYSKSKSKLYLRLFNSQSHSNITFNNYKFSLMLVEGKYTSETIPAFEPYDNTLVNSKVQYLLSTNKNLFDYDNSDYREGYYIVDGSVNKANSYTNNYTKIIGNLDYYITLTGGDFDSFEIYFYDINKTKLSTIVQYNRQFTFKTPKDCYYIRLAQYKNGTSKNPTQIMLNYGTEAKDYVPHQTDKLIINEELGAFDYYDFTTNKKHLQTSQMVTFDGNENLNYDSNFQRFYINPSSLGLPIAKAGVTNCYSNDIASINIYTDGDLIAFNTALWTDVSEFKIYLQSNPITLVYELAEETVEDLTLADGLAVWEGGLQEQHIEGKYLPYIIEKVYSVTVADQLEANRIIDKSQQEQLDILNQTVLGLGFDKVESVEMTEQAEIVGETGSTFGLSLQPQQAVVSEIKGNTDIYPNIYPNDGTILLNSLGLKENTRYKISVNFSNNEYLKIATAFGASGGDILGGINRGDTSTFITYNSNKQWNMYILSVGDGNLPITNYTISIQEATLVNSKANLISTNKNLYDCTKYASTYNSELIYLARDVDYYIKNFDGILTSVVFRDLKGTYLTEYNSSPIKLNALNLSSGYYMLSFRKSSTEYYDLTKPNKIYLGTKDTSEYIPHLEDEVAYPELAFTDTYYPLQKKIIRHQITKTTYDGSSDENWGREENSGYAIFQIFFTATNGTADLSQSSIKAVSNLYNLGNYGELGTFYIAGDNWLRLFLSTSITLDKFKQNLQSNPLEIWYDAGNETIEEYSAPSGIQITPQGLLYQETDTIPYSSIKLQLGYGMKDQMEKINTVNRNQQSQIDENKANIEANKNSFDEFKQAQEETNKDVDDFISKRSTIKYVELEINKTVAANSISAYNWSTSSNNKIIVSIETDSGVVAAGFPYLFNNQFYVIRFINPTANQTTIQNIRIGYLEL